MKLRTQFDMLYIAIEDTPCWPALGELVVSLNSEVDFHAELLASIRALHSREHEFGMATCSYELCRLAVRA